MDSILTSIKKLLGIEEAYEQFDTDVTIHINTAISALTQMGVGSDLSFSVADKADLWVDWLGTDATILGSVKSYIYLKVRLIFDPPTNTTVVKSYEQLLSELEFRIMVATEPALVEVPLVGDELDLIIDGG